MLMKLCNVCLNREDWLSGNVEEGQKSRMRELVPGSVARKKWSGLLRELGLRCLQRRTEIEAARMGAKVMNPLMSRQSAEIV